MIDYNNHKTNNHERKQAMENVTQKNEKSISGAIKIDEKEIGDHLNQLVLDFFVSHFYLMNDRYL